MESIIADGYVKIENANLMKMKNNQFGVKIVIILEHKKTYQKIWYFRFIYHQMYCNNINNVQCYLKKY